MRKIVISMLCFAICNQAIAVDWYRVNKSSNGHLISYVDLDSVIETKISGRNYLMLNAKYELSQDSELFREQGILTRNIQYYISCNNQSSFVKARVDYDNQGKIVDSYKSTNFPLEQNFDYAFPETIIDGIIDVSCGFYYPSELQKRTSKSKLTMPAPRVCRHLHNDDRVQCVMEILGGKRFN